MEKVMLIVRDGWGYSRKTDGNAIHHGNTPFNDYLKQNTPQILLKCHGEEVGLPEGFQGSSEVGHLNMGAGRIVEQEVTRIFAALKDRSLFESQAFSRIHDRLSGSGTRLHLFGLLQDEGVHAHQEHLFELIRYASEKFPDLPVWIHPVADGRDTPPRSFEGFFNRLTDEIHHYNNVQIGTVCGRYYGMDRSENWDLINVAVNAMVYGEGLRTDNIVTAVKTAYEQDKTPGDVPMFDEYLKPIISRAYDGIKPGDVIINFNYRQDRAIQISRAFCDPTCAIYQDLQIHYYGLTRYYDEFQNYLIAPMSEKGGMEHILGEVLSDQGLSQLRIAETQKFRHVTSFFNGKATRPFPGEDQVNITSEFDPSSFALHPEMNAADVTAELLDRLKEGYNFILVNYANCDMVGHTGDFDAALKGAEYVDQNVAVICKMALKEDYIVLVTADHGNSEEMFDEHGKPKTSHTVNPVKCHLLDDQGRFKFDTSQGILSDLAPLILKLMGVSIPKEMSSRYLSENLKIMNEKN